MADMRAFGNLISGVNQPGAGYRPGIDPEHAYYNYTSAPGGMSGPAAQDATGGASQPLPPNFGEVREEGGGQRDDGYDPNQGAKDSDLSLWDAAKLAAPWGLALAKGGPLGVAAKAAIKLIRGVSANEDFRSTSQVAKGLGAIGTALNDDMGDFGGGGSTMGDIGGSRVDNSGPSGAPDDIGTRDGGDGGGAQGDTASGHSRDSGERGFGGGYHQGGPVTDQNPATYQENMEITAQEGEVVMTREAVSMLGVDFFEQINQAAKQGGQPNQQPQVPAGRPAPATGMPAFAQMAGGAPR